MEMKKILLLGILNTVVGSRLSIDYSALKT